jgi:hypothetical protein
VLFLIQYARKQGQPVALTQSWGEQRKAAEDTRLELEISLNMKRINHEVVLLQADDEDAIRRTHGRYFKTLADLVGFMTVLQTITYSRLEDRL